MKWRYVGVVILMGGLVLFAGPAYGLTFSSLGTVVFTCVPLYKANSLISANGGSLYADPNCPPYYSGYYYAFIGSGVTTTYSSTQTQAPYFSNPPPPPATTTTTSSSQPAGGGPPPPPPPPPCTATLTFAYQNGNNPNNGQVVANGATYNYGQSLTASCNSQISVQAYPTALQQSFQSWALTGGGSIANQYATTTTVTMPSSGFAYLWFSSTQAMIQSSTSTSQVPAGNSQTTTTTIQSQTQSFSTSYATSTTTFQTSTSVSGTYSTFSTSSVITSTILIPPPAVGQLIPGIYNSQIFGGVLSVFGIALIAKGDEEVGEGA